MCLALQRRLDDCSFALAAMYSCQKHASKSVRIHLYRYLARHPRAAWEDVPNLPKAAVQLLNEEFAHLTTSVLQCQTSSSADTTKLLLKLQNGMQVESVIMHYDTTGR